MSRPFNRFLPGASPVSIRRLSSDAGFEKLFHSSQALRQACGFDSELFDAVQGLTQRSDGPVLKKANI